MLNNLGRANRVLMLGLFVFALSDGLWFNLRQLYLAELGATASQVGLALSVASLAAALVPIPMGQLSDRFGPKALILLPWSMAALGTFLMSMAPSWQLATVGLATYILCVGANPALVSFVLHNLPDDGAYGSTERALTTVFGVYPLTLVVAPAIGGAIAGRWGLGTDLRLAMLGFGFAVIILSLAEPRPHKSESTSEGGNPLPSNSSFMVQITYFTLTLVALYLGYLLLPNYLEEVRGYSKTVIGSLFSVLSIGTVLFNALTGRIKPRAGFAVLLTAPWVALAILCQVPSLPYTVLSFALLGAISTTWPLIQASIDRVVQPANRGVALGVVETLTRLALAVASALAGRFYDQSPAHDLPFQLAIVTIPLMLLVWLFLPQRFFARRIPSPR